MLRLFLFLTCFSLTQIANAQVPEADFSAKLVNAQFGDSCFPLGACADKIKIVATMNMDIVIESLPVRPRQVFFQIYDESTGTKEPLYSGSASIPAIGSEDLTAKEGDLVNGKYKATYFSDDDRFKLRIAIFAPIQFIDRGTYSVRMSFLEGALLKEFSSTLSASGFRL